MLFAHMLCTEKRRLTYRHMVVALIALLNILPLHAKETITVAVAANLRSAFVELALAFEQQTGIEAQASFSATGKLATQIRQGAPFHLLLAADSDTPRRLHADGYALLPARPYATGVLVLWTTRTLNLHDWPALVQSERVQHIAIANPATAPYGMEAMRVLQHYKLLPLVQHKLVYGESIGQTDQFIASGAADLGFTAKSSVLASTQAEPHQWLELPANNYRPIIQSAILLRHAGEHQRAAAERFFVFLFSPSAQTLLQQHGYLAP